MKPSLICVSTSKEQIGDRPLPFCGNRDEKRTQFGEALGEGLALNRHKRSYLTLYDL